MMTFLTYPDFRKSAQTLDKRRCFSQVREAKQIRNVREGKSKGYKNHPAVLMLKGFEKELKHYYNIFLSHRVAAIKKIREKVPGFLIRK